MSLFEISNMPQAEEVAARIVAMLCCGTEAKIRKRDVPSAPPMTHDYDICIDGRIIGLEVTSINDQNLKSLWADSTQKEWHEPSLEKAWLIKLFRSVKIKKLRKSGFANYLKVFEISGFTTINTEDVPYDWPSEAKKAAEDLRRCGVKYANVLDDRNPGYISINISGDGHWINSDSLVDSVQQAINENTAKIQGVMSDERHLFVWIDLSASLEGGAFDEIIHRSTLPSQVLNLSGNLDCVWIKVLSRNVDCHPLVKYTMRDGWKIVDQIQGTTHKQH